MHEEGVDESTLPLRRRGWGRQLGGPLAQHIILGGCWPIETWEPNSSPSVGVPN